MRENPRAVAVHPALAHSQTLRCYPVCGRYLLFCPDVCLFLLRRYITPYDSPIFIVCLDKEKMYLCYVQVNQDKLKVIDLFCGCGGLSLGFELAGFTPVLAVDNWQDAVDSYRKNNPSCQVLCADLTKIHPEDIKNQNKLGHITAIIGGPPCQGFSIAGKRIIEDVRNSLYKSFVSFVRCFSPDFFVMENVPNILTMGQGVIRNSIIQEFEGIGYKVHFKVLVASDFGVPQNRRRAFFVGIKGKAKSFKFPQPLASPKITSEEAISDLPFNSVPDGAPYPTPPQSDYQFLMRANSSSLYNHQNTSHNKKTIDIISLVPDGGNYKDLPLELQSTRRVHIAWTRLNSKKPSFTIDTGHRHHFHYCYNRIPSVRECARIQSFPDNFIFTHSRTSQYKQVGNAVPPMMARAVAEELFKII